MQTIPYTTPKGIIELVRKDEHDAAVAKLEAEISRWQAMAGQLAKTFKVFIEEYEDRKCQFGSDYLWQKHEDFDAINRSNQALAAYESAVSGNPPDPLTEAVKRMEAVPVEVLYTDYLHHESPKCYDCMEAVRTRLIQAAKGEQP